MKHILLTGGSGFIGRNIIESFAEKYSVFAPNRKELNVLHTDKVVEYVKKHKIDSIIHSATAVHGDYFEPTIMMMRSIVEASQYVHKVIYFGSGAEYGKHRELHRISEDSIGKILPNDTNGLSKYINTMLSRSGNNITVLRLFGVYGKYEDYTNKFISNAIVKHIFHLPVVINQDALFDYLFIDDLMPILIAVIEQDLPHKDYNITPDTSVLLSEIASMINLQNDQRVQITINNPGLNYEYTGDNTRLKQDVPHIRFTPYTDAISLLYRYYEQNQKTLDISCIKKDEYLTRVQADTK